MLLLAVSMILFVIFYQKRLLKQQLRLQEIQAKAQWQLLNATIETQEKERKRISQDLHDEIGAQLSTAKLGVGKIIRLSKEMAMVGDQAMETKNMLDEIISNVRQLSRELLPATLEEFGLEVTFEELRKRVEANADFELNFNIEHKIPRMEVRKELYLYRVVQELLNNAIKHSQATVIELNATLTGDRLYLEFKDNGVGFDMSKLQQNNGSARGLGLYNIESRISMLNAKMSYDSAPQQGTRIGIDLQINH